MDDWQAMQEAVATPRTGIMLVHAPFSRDQVWSLNAFQDSRTGHPYTCPNPHPPKLRNLVATSLGWQCRDDTCGYMQDWAHAYTANWEWRSQLDDAAWKAMGHRESA